MRPDPEVQTRPDGESRLALPSELIALDQWIAWWAVEGRNRLVQLPDGSRTGVLKPQPKPHKLPIDPHTGGLGRVNDLRTWAPYAEAAAAVEKYAVTGIGFVFTDNDPFSGIDIDNCRDPKTGTLTDWAQEIIRFLDSYTEVSPSGTGVKIWVNGKLPNGTRNQKAYRTGKVEMFSRRRYFTCTGQRLEGSPTNVELRQQQLSSLHASLFTPPVGQLIANEEVPEMLTDSEIIDRASSAGDGSKFRRLWRGEWKGEYPSQSEADQALCCILAFWTACDPQRIDRLFRRSGLYRGKWEREDYRRRTISTATGLNRERFRGSEPQDSFQSSDDQSQPCLHHTGNSASGGKTSVSKARPGGRQRANVDDLASEITKCAHFAQDRGGRLYVFEEGVYKSTGEQFVARRVKEVMQAWRITDKWTSRKSKEVAAFIRVDSPILWQTPPVEILNLRNGLFEIQTGVLSSHRADFLSSVQLPVAYDPQARCPAWEKFVGDVFPEDSRAIAWELPAWLMTSDMSIQKAVLLTGEGGNGKSTYLRGLTAFIGKDNVAAVSLQRLECDKFAVARLVGKLANICPDLPSAHLASTSIFKALTGGDLLQAEYKYSNSFEFTPHSKLVFSANQPPHSDDATHAYFRRWVIVPFGRTFDEGAAGTIPRSEMDTRLAEPSELSGLLNHALEALPKFRQHGFTTNASMCQAFAEFHDSTNPLSLWLDQNTIESPDGLVPKGALIQAFNEAREKLGKARMSNTAFGRALKRVRPGVNDGQRTVNGKVTECYLGLALSRKQG